MFFAKPGVYKPAGLFSFDHLIILIVSIIAIYFGLKRTVISSNADITKIIRKVTIIMWILEIIKIIFNFKIGNGNNLNTFVPLYFCSILLYAGILSGWCSNDLKRIGDVFLVTGGVIAGICFLILPTTSITNYPLFHFLSFHSFFYHSVMIYLGLLMIKYNYVVLNNKDIIYYAILVFIMCLLAFIINTIFDSNLMFISKYFKPLAFIYNLTGKFYPLVMTILQMTVPYYFMYFILKKK